MLNKEEITKNFIDEYQDAFYKIDMYDLRYYFKKYFFENYGCNLDLRVHSSREAWLSVVNCYKAKKGELKCLK